METTHPTPAQPSRRTVLTGLAAGSVLGAYGLRSAAPAAAHGEIVSYPDIDGAPTVYEASETLTSFGYRPSFHGRLGSWLQFWDAHTPDSFGRQFQVWSLGAHADHRVSEAHNNGRGFDLTRIFVTDGSGELVERFNARRDIWQGWPEEDQVVQRRRYWATSASAHHHFAHVLTYAWDPAGHNNHIHIDNLVSGSGNSTFTTGSQAQVYHVQGACRYVWGLPTTLDGIWGPETDGHSTRVLRAAGAGSGSLTSSLANWQTFNTATVRNGYGTQSYPAP